MVGKGRSKRTPYVNSIPVTHDYPKDLPSDFRLELALNPTQAFSLGNNCSRKGRAILQKNHRVPIARIFLTRKVPLR